MTLCCSLQHWVGSGEGSGFLVPLKRHKGVITVGAWSGGWWDNIGWDTCDNYFLFSILATALCEFSFFSPKSYQIYLELPTKGTNTCPLGTYQVHCSSSCLWWWGPASVEDASIQPAEGTFSSLLSSSCQKLGGQWPWGDASFLTKNTPLCSTITRNQREAVYSPKTSQRYFRVNTATSVSLPSTFFLESSNAIIEISSRDKFGRYHVAFLKFCSQTHWYTYTLVDMALIRGPFFLCELQSPWSWLHGLSEFLSHCGLWLWIIAVLTLHSFCKF